MTRMVRSFSRRAYLRSAGGIAASLALPDVFSSPSSTIRIGRLATQKGSLGWGQSESHKGAQAAVAEVNASGGIDGRRVEVISVEDPSSGTETQALAKRLIEIDQVVCFIGGGSQTVASMLPLLTAARVPLVGATTGLDSLRTHRANVFWTRPTYGMEIARIVEHLKIVGQERCAVSYTDNTFGRAAFAAFQATAEKVKTMQWKAFVLGNEKEQLERLVAEMKAWGPNSLVSLAASPLAIPFFKAMRASISAPAYNYSLAGSKPVLEALGEHARGIIVTQVVPSPDAITIRLVHDYNASLKRIPDANPNYTSLEGYVGARVLIEGLRRSGGSNDRERLVQALDSMRSLDLGGFGIRYAADDHDGSRFVELTYFDGQRFRR